MHSYAVAPLAVTRRDTYTYHAAAKLPPGAVVTVPYAGRTVSGVVMGPVEPITPSKELSDTGERLASWQLQFAQGIAEAYLTPLGAALGLLMPKWRGTGFGGEVKKAGTTKVSLLTDAGPWPTYANAVRQADHQKLVLVSEAALTKQSLPGAIRFTATMPVNERRAAWEAVCSNPQTVVVGTRSALFLPWQRLGLVIVDQEDELGHLNERTPRYHAREAARLLAQLQGADLVLSSFGPSLRAWTLAEQPRVAQAAGTGLEIVGMRRRREDPLPFGLVDRLQEAAGDIFIHTLPSKAAAVRAALRAAGIRRVRVGGQPELFSGRQYQLIVSLDVDALLARPGYAVTERAASLLRKLSARLADAGQLLAYTKHPDHPAFAAASDYPAFLATELAERQALRLPPEHPLVRIETTQKDALKLKTALANLNIPARDIRLTTDAGRAVVLIKGDPQPLRALITPERRISVDY